MHNDCELSHVVLTSKQQSRARGRRGKQADRKTGRQRQADRHADRGRQVDRDRQAYTGRQAEEDKAGRGKHTDRQTDIH